MRTSLDHLPSRKVRELERVRQVILEEFELATRALRENTKRTGRDALHHPRIIKLILFGSYTGERWVEDHANSYFSDYDILAVVNDERLADESRYWPAVRGRLSKEWMVGRIETPVQLIVHGYGDLNDKLSKGRPFFLDIARDGIVLFDEKGWPLAKPRKLPIAEAYSEAVIHYRYRFTRGSNFIKSVKLILQGPDLLNEAAFILHQATEHLYHCVLLTISLYSPKQHDLVELRKMAEPLDKRLAEAWPRITKQDNDRFDLLRRAYVEARYSPDYKITLDELEWLIGRVEHMRDLVEQACTEHLTAMAEKAGVPVPEGGWLAEPAVPESSEA